MPIRRARTADLSPDELGAIRELLWVAFGDEDDERMTEEDWEHALGGTHFLLEEDGEIVGHAAVVDRTLYVGERPLRTGYVEAVATARGRQGRGHGSALMTAVNACIRDRYELGGLGTGRHGFYERLGWQIWRGPTFVRTETGTVATPDEDGYILVLTTPRTPPLDFSDPIACESRPGDDW